MYYRDFRAWLCFACSIIFSVGATAQDIENSALASLSANFQTKQGFALGGVIDGRTFSPIPAGMIIDTDWAQRGEVTYIDFKFTDPYALTSVKIWNGNDGPSVGIAQIRLEFRRADGAVISVRDYALDPMQMQMQELAFSNQNSERVDWVRFFILDEFMGAEQGISEIRFVGTPSPPLTPTNRPPVGSDQTLGVTGARKNGDLFDYVTDPDGDNLTISSLQIIPPIPMGYGADGNFNITFPDNGIYLLNYMVSDGRGGSEQVNLTFNVSGIVPDTPQPPNDDNGLPWPWILGGALAVLLGLGVGRLRRKPSKSNTEKSAGVSMTAIGGAAGLAAARSWLKPLAKPKSGLPLWSPKPERPPESGLVFPGSALAAGAVAPGPAAIAPMGQMVPAGLQNLTGQFAALKPAYEATGRIGGPQVGVPTQDDVSFGTGFLVTKRHVMTNQHVYEFYKHYLTGDDCGGIEFVAERDRDASDYYAFDGNPPLILADLDIAIFTLAKAVPDRTPINRVNIPTDKLADIDVITVSYPCPFEVDETILSVVEPDPIWAVKRLSQGKVFRHSTHGKTLWVDVTVDPRINPNGKISAICHNASTLGGSSGAPVLDKKGRLTGVHFAGDRAFNGAEAANLAMAIEQLASIAIELDEE